MVCMPRDAESARTFVIDYEKKYVECLACDVPSIRFQIMHHATQCKKHINALRIGAWKDRERTVEVGAAALNLNEAIEAVRSLKEERENRKLQRKRKRASCHNTQARPSSPRAPWPRALTFM